MQSSQSNVAALPRKVSYYLTAQQQELLKRAKYPNATTDDYDLFIGVCNRTGLDPFSNQIILSTTFSTKLNTHVSSALITVDGLRAIAERSGSYAGQTPVEWCGEDGIFKEVWLEKKPPSAAKVGVYRAGFAQPLYAVAKWDTYAKYEPSNQTGEYILCDSWRTMADIMIAKCAESLALRKAFPNDLSGLYSVDETKGVGTTLGVSGLVAFPESHPGLPANVQNGTDNLGAISPNKTIRDETKNPNHEQLDSTVSISQSTSSTGNQKPFDDAEKEAMLRHIELAVTKGIVVNALNWARQRFTGERLKFFSEQLALASQANNSTLNS